jgi:protein-export membrane protein SecD
MAERPLLSAIFSYNRAHMWRKRFIALVLLLAGFGVAFFVVESEKGPESVVGNFPFKYGLDIKGGTHLVYGADISKIIPSEVAQTMESLRDVIERRVNLFGVSEAIVQVEQGSTLAGDGGYRLIVELPGVTDIEQAVELIGQTPLLEFKTERPEGAEKDAIVAAYKKAQSALTSSTATGITQEEILASSPLLSEDPNYVPTKLTGAYLKKATLQFDPRTSEPRIVLSFTEEGKKLFAEITEANVGKTVAIYLDGQPLSTPVVREAIKDGNAEITGSFNIAEAKTLVGRMNSGALPVPITLLSTQTIGASLGEKALNASTKAGIIGILLVGVFLILWYRFPGVIAVVALGVYIAIMLAVFKLIPVTLTAAGIAGFILSIGMAVDANILIFERMKEELKDGKNLDLAMKDGFARAWLSIRDSNIASIISATILFWFGTSLVKGFALTLGIGVLVSMFSAITVTRTFLRAFASEKRTRAIHVLFGSGIN